MVEHGGNVGSEASHWRMSDVGTERVIWLRIHGVPCHVWSVDFFISISNSLGTYVCVDDNT